MCINFWLHPPKYPVYVIINGGFFNFLWVRTRIDIIDTCTCMYSNLLVVTISVQLTLNRIVMYITHCAGLDTRTCNQCVYVYMQL